MTDKVRGNEGCTTSMPGEDPSRTLYTQLGTWACAAPDNHVNCIQENSTVDVRSNKATGNGQAGSKLKLQMQLRT